MNRQYTEVSHFRAPYKNAMLSGVGDAYSGYGVYEGVGHDEEARTARSGERELSAMRNQWAVGQGAQRMWGPNPWNGVGAVDTPVPPPLTTPEPPLSSLDPFFVINGGITFATDATATALNATMAQWAGTDPAFAVPDAIGQTISFVVYHGMAQPPPGSEPGPYTPLASLLAPMLPKAGDHVAMLIDKRFATPTPGKRTLILTRNPKIIADNAGKGGAYFLTSDADDVIVAQAKAMTGIFGGLQAGFLSTPMGLVTTVMVVGGVLYFAVGAGGGKKRRSH
jgi:hypothetical protein